MTTSRGARAASSRQEAAGLVDGVVALPRARAVGRPPSKVTVAWIEPDAPRLSLLSLGSRQTARSTRPSSGSCVEHGAELVLEERPLLARVEDEREVDARAAARSCSTRSSISASPLFMSDAPGP